MDNQEKKQNKKLEWVKKHLPDIALGALTVGALTALGIQTYKSVQTQDIYQRKIIEVGDLEIKKQQTAIDLLSSELIKATEQSENKE